MEEENKIEPQVEVNNESKKFDLKTFDYKKYLPWAGIALAVIAVIIILITLLGGGPKKAVKKFVSGMSSKNASKIINSIDFAGSEAWKYSYDPEDFSEEEYEEFIENYKDVDKDEIKDQQKEMKETLEDGFEEMKDEYKSFKMKIKSFKSKEKIGKNLYTIKARVTLIAKPKDKDEDEMDSTKTVIFVVYKNKIVYSELFGLY